MSSIYSMRKQIKKNNHTIYLLSWDAIGSDAWSNVQRIKKLRSENDHLRKRIKRKQAWNKFWRKIGLSRLSGDSHD